MKQKIFAAPLFFVFGLFIAYQAESFLYSSLFSLMEWTSFDNFEFGGKFFRFFPYAIYLGIPAAISLFGLANLGKSVATILENALYALILFSTTMILGAFLVINISFLNKIDYHLIGFGVGYSQVNTDLILMLAAFLSALPSILQLIKKEKTPQQVYV